jgi:LysR family nitrogen assimilation transcriptional regulator
MNINTSSKALPLIEEDLFLYISKQPQNPSYSELALYSNMPFRDLQHYEIFVPEQQDALTQLLHLEAQKLGIKLKSKRGFGQLMTTLHYVTQGVGLIICPSSATFHLEQCGQIRPIQIREPNLNRMVYLQMAEQKQNNNIVKAIYELVREVSAETHANQQWRGKLIDEKYQRIDSSNVGGLLSESIESLEDFEV